MEPLKFVIWHQDKIYSNEDMVKKIGGKAIGLHELKGLAINVPLWATITSDLFKAICNTDKKLSGLLREEKENLQKASSIRNYVKNIKIGTTEEKVLTDVWENISKSGEKAVAVRSSAADEDSESLSFAGQMDSFLNIRTKDEFLRAVRCCWASLYGERAVLYRIKNGIEPWSPQIAVIVQEMIESELSGVIFTANPLTGNRKQMLVSSTWGLGEGIVSGRLDADTFVLDSNGDTVKSDIAEKKRCIVYKSGGDTKSVDVGKDKQCTVSLRETQLWELHKMALNVQDLKAIPMDIEFAIAEDTIYLLQARPITNLKEYTEPKKDNYKVWDNSNIVESYSGVTTPLTFSFIKRAYFAAYWQFWETIGVDRKTIFKNRYVLENMLGLIEGRVYYNLLNWYQLISMMPGFKYNKDFMGQMMGLQVAKDYLEIEKPKSKLEKYFVHLPKLIKVAFKMVFAHLTLQKRIDEFHMNFHRIYSHYSKLDYNKITPAELLEISRILEDKILWNWKAPILNDLEAMIFYGILKKLTVKWEIDEIGTLHNDLLSGEGSIRSTRVVTELFSIAKRIAEKDELKTSFLQLSPADALSKLRNSPEFSHIRTDFEKYLEDYGVRSIEEMKLESISIKDNPTFCIAMIQNYLRYSVTDPKEQQEKEQSIRIKAESKLREKLKGKRMMLFIPKFSVYRWVLKHTRNAIRNRENQRFARAEAYSLTRGIVRAVGKHWEEKGIIEKTEDIFYLEWEEIWSFVEGTSTCTNLKELIKLRRNEFDSYHFTNPDDHIETYGDVYSENIFTEKEEISEKDNLLKGLGCCAGIVEKEVKIVVKPDIDIRLNGEIMIAKQTDPGWVVLFPSVSGLIIEKGSMLSHSAIVAREMGIPAVVGVKNATKILKNGDKVRLNGATGTIEILQRAKSAE